MMRARWVLLVVGVVITVVGFVGLVDEDNRLKSAAPWWLVGLVGLSIVLLALGSPGSRRATDG